MAGKPECPVPPAPAPPGQPSPLPDPQQSQTQPSVQNVILYVSENYPQTYVSQQNVECNNTYSNATNSTPYINASPASSTMKYNKNQEFMSNGFLPMQNNAAYYQNSVSEGSHEMQQNSNFHSCQVAPDMLNNLGYPSDANGVINHGFSNMKQHSNVGGQHQLGISQSVPVCSTSEPSSQIMLSNGGMYGQPQPQQNVAVSCAAVHTFIPANHLEHKHQEIRQTSSADVNLLSVMGSDSGNGNSNLAITRCDSVRSEAAESSCSSLSSTETHQENTSNPVTVLLPPAQMHNHMPVNHSQLIQRVQSVNNVTGFIPQTNLPNTQIFAGQNQQVFVDTSAGHQVVQSGVNQHYIPPSDIAGASASDNHSQFFSGGDKGSVTTSHNQQEMLANGKCGSNQLEIFSPGNHMVASQAQTSQSGLVPDLRHLHGPPSTSALPHGSQRQFASQPGSVTTVANSSGIAVVTTSVHDTVQFVTTVAGNQKIMAVTANNHSEGMIDPVTCHNSDDRVVLNSAVNLLTTQTESMPVTNEVFLSQHTIVVPFGWKRFHNNGSVFYVSPSRKALSSLDQVREYLLTAGTCKCGLDCPLRPDIVFNFDPKVSSRPCADPSPSAFSGDMTRLCNHKRKAMAMASLAPICSSLPDGAYNKRGGYDKRRAYDKTRTYEKRAAGGTYARKKKRKTMTSLAGGPVQQNWNGTENNSPVAGVPQGEMVPSLPGQSQIVYSHLGQGSNQVDEIQKAQEAAPKQLGQGHFENGQNSVCHLGQTSAPSNFTTFGSGHMNNGKPMHNQMAEGQTHVSVSQPVQASIQAAQVHPGQSVANVPQSVATSQTLESRQVFQGHINTYVASTQTQISACQMGQMNIGHDQGSQMRANECYVNDGQYQHNQMVDSHLNAPPPSCAPPVVQQTASSNEYQYFQHQQSHTPQSVPHQQFQQFQHLHPHHHHIQQQQFQHHQFQPHQSYQEHQQIPPTQEQVQFRQDIQHQQQIQRQQQIQNQQNQPNHLQQMQLHQQIHQNSQHQAQVQEQKHLMAHHQAHMHQQNHLQTTEGQHFEQSMQTMHQSVESSQHAIPHQPTHYPPSHHLVSNQSHSTIPPQSQTAHHTHSHQPVSNQPLHHAHSASTITAQPSLSHYPQSTHVPPQSSSTHHTQPLPYSTLPGHLAHTAQQPDPCPTPAAPYTQNQPRRGSLAGAPWHQNLSSFDRVPPLHQHVPVPAQPTWNEEPAPVVRRRGARSKVYTNKKGRAPYAEHRARQPTPTPCPNVVVRQLPQENRPSFMDDPSAYLAQQTALLHSTISRQTGEGASPQPSPINSPAASPFFSTHNSQSPPSASPSATPSPHSTSSSLCRQPDSSAMSPERGLHRPRSVEENPVTSSTASDRPGSSSEDFPMSCESSQQSSHLRTECSPGVVDSHVDNAVKIRQEEASTTVRIMKSSQGIKPGPIQSGTVSTCDGADRQITHPEGCSSSPGSSSSQFAVSSASVANPSSNISTSTINNITTHENELSVNDGTKNHLKQLATMTNQQVRTSQQPSLHNNQNFNYQLNRTVQSNQKSKGSRAKKGNQSFPFLQNQSQITTMASGHTVSCNTITSVLAGKNPTSTVTASVTLSPPSKANQEQQQPVSAPKTSVDLVQNVVYSTAVSITNEHKLVSSLSHLQHQQTTQIQPSSQLDVKIIQQQNQSQQRIAKVPSTYPGAKDMLLTSQSESQPLQHQIGSKVANQVQQIYFQPQQVQQKPQNRTQQQENQNTQNLLPDEKAPLQQILQNIPIQPHVQITQAPQTTQQPITHQEAAKQVADAFQSHSNLTVQQQAQQLAQQLAQQIAQQQIQQQNQKVQLQAGQQKTQQTSQSSHQSIQVQGHQLPTHVQSQQQAAVVVKPPAGLQATLPAHHILVSSGGQLLVASSAATGLAKPAMPTLSVSPLVTSVTAAMTQVIPAVMQQAQPMQLGPMVLNALNALQGPLVLPGVGGVIGVDGLTQNTTVQIPQLTVSNVVQSDPRSFIAQQQPALLSPPEPTTKKKSSSKKKKTPVPQTVALQISTQPHQQTQNIAPAFSSSSSVSPFNGTPLLTLVPGKSPGAPPQIVVNHAATAHSPNNAPAQPCQASPQQTQTFSSSQPLASPAAGGHINLLQPVGVVTAPLQQFIVPGLVMATDGSGNTTLIQDPVGSLTNIQNIPNVQTIQNMQNVGVQLQLQNVNGQNVLTPVQTPVQVQGTPGIVFQRNTPGPAPKFTTAQFISSPTSPAQFIIPTSTAGVKQQFLHSPTGGTQFLIPSSSPQGKITASPHQFFAATGSPTGGTHQFANTAGTQLLATSSSGGGAQFLTTAAAFGGQLSGQLSPLLASLSPNGQLQGQHITLSAANGQTIQMPGQLGPQTLVVPCSIAGQRQQQAIAPQKLPQEIQIAVSLAQLHQNEQQKHHSHAHPYLHPQQATSSTNHRKSGLATVTSSKHQEKVGTSAASVRQSVSTQTLQRQTATATNTTSTSSLASQPQPRVYPSSGSGSAAGAGGEIVASPSTSLTTSGSPPDTTTLSPVGLGGATPQHSPTVDTTTSSVDDLGCSSTRSAVESPSVSPQSASPHHRQISTPSLAMVQCVSSSNAEPESGEAEWKTPDHEKTHSNRISVTSPSSSRSENYLCHSFKSFVESSSHLYKHQPQLQPVMFAYNDGLSRSNLNLKRKHSVGESASSTSLGQITHMSIHQLGQQLHAVNDDDNVKGNGGQCAELSVGDLVWGPARGFPAWPGQLVAGPDSPPSPAPALAGHVWVRWFSGGAGADRDRSLTLVSRDCLKSLSEGLETHHRAIKKFRKGRKMNSQLECAIQEAMSELDRMSDKQRSQDKQESRVVISEKKTAEHEKRSLPLSSSQKSSTSTPGQSLRTTRSLVAASLSVPANENSPSTRLRRSNR